MTLDLEPAQLARLIAWGGLLLGLILGLVGQATRFCVRGAIADWVQLRAPGRALSWLLAIAVGAVGVQGLLSAGLLDGSRLMHWSDRLLWLSCLVGGLLFGFGMILAGGCPQRCLVKAGSGNLKAAFVLVLVAIAAAMTLRGMLAIPRMTLLDTWMVNLGGSQDLGRVLGSALDVDAQALRWGLAGVLLAAVLALAWRLRARMERAHWTGGVVVGLLVAAAFYLTGHLGYLPEHPETLEPAWLGTQSRRPEGLSFSAPMAHLLDLLTLWTDATMVATFGVLLALGVLAGSFVSARLRGEFRLETFTSPGEMGAHATGALLMGFGGISALGCSVGNGVTGLALQSSGAVLAVAGICLGAWLALRWQARRAGHAAASGQPAPAPAKSTC